MNSFRRFSLALFLGLTSTVAMAQVSDRAAGGSFGFLEAGSIVVDFYADFAGLSRVETRYLVLDMKRGDGRPSSIDLVKCPRGTCWERAMSERLRNVPTLRDYVGQRFGAERWDAMRSDINAILAIQARELAAGSNRIWSSPQTQRRVVGSDPGPNRSFSIAIVDECPMLRGLYDIDGLPGGKVAEYRRMLNPAHSQLDRATFERARDRVIAVIRTYVRDNFPGKLN